MELMEFTYPHTIENGLGEKLTFLEVLHGPEGDRLIVENFAAPGSGPPMHVHWIQDEVLTVVTAESVIRYRGSRSNLPKRAKQSCSNVGYPTVFGTPEQRCSIVRAGSIRLIRSCFFFRLFLPLEVKSGKVQPEMFDAAYLLTRYKDEFDMLEIPRFVRRVVLPIIYQIGRILGKYKHFEGAPEPVPASSRAAVALLNFGTM